MLFYVVECFTVNLENLATDAVGSVQVGGFDDDVQRECRFVAETLGKSLHQVEEIGALETFGISPVEFLVLPRMVALILVMPFLCAFADLISIAGGFIVSVCMLDVSATEYLTRTVQAIQLKSFLLGIGKGSFFGFLVAYSGCLRGIQSGYSAADVGQATTRAVVTGITAIIASDGIFAVLCNALRI